MAAVFVVNVSTSPSAQSIDWRDPAPTSIRAPSLLDLNSTSPNRALLPIC